jgi:hypothetical protein
MKPAAKTTRDYKLSYKKKSATTDTYLQRRSTPSLSVCESCYSIYKNKRWYPGTADYQGVVNHPSTTKTVCPACMKIRDNFPGGIVTLKGGYALPHKTDLINLIRNEEERARGLNPLERVISIKENGFGSIVILTTNEKLAQRIGRAVKKAFHGEVTYQWSHDNKLVRVDWMRQLPEERP